jgi:hypothetical protein
MVIGTEAIRSEGKNQVAAQLFQIFRVAPFSFFQGGQEPENPSTLKGPKQYNHRIEIAFTAESAEYANRERKL